MDVGFGVRGYRKCVISGFRHEVAENCPLLGYYAASGGNFSPLLAT
jgi:hypothetical protein